MKTGRKGRPGRRISLRGSPKPRAPDGEDYRVYRLSAKEYMGLSAIGLGLCGLTAYVFYRSFFAFILLMPLGFLYPIYKKKDLKKKRLRQLTLQFKEAIQVQEEIQTMTAARIFEQKIMNGIPFGMILYIDFTSPGFFDIMYGTWMGRLIMTLCLAFYMGAVMLSGKILDIEI